MTLHIIEPSTSVKSLAWTQLSYLLLLEVTTCARNQNRGGQVSQVVEKVSLLGAQRGTDNPSQGIAVQDQRV